MCLILQEFVELNYKKLKLTDELIRLITQHREAATMLMAHYNVRQVLEHPIIEYVRYVLAKGTDNEKCNLVNGINDDLNLTNGQVSVRSQGALLHY